MPILPSGKELIDPYFVLNQARIAEGMTVADFGCGTLGHYVFPAARLVDAEGKVYAVDIQKGVLNSIDGRSKFESVHNVEAIWGDIERDHGVAIKDNKCDIVLIINNLYLAKNKDQMFTETKRVLKNGGKLVIVDWIATKTPFGPPVGDRVSKVRVVEVLKKLGLSKVADFKAGDYHYGLVFKK